MQDRYCSQYGQDKFLDEKIFKKRRNGYFIDIGANDGVTYSNTYFFERYRDWKGICIEPHPTAFMKLTHNRVCELLNVGISDKEGELEFLKIEGYAEMLSGLKSNYNPSHLKRIDDEVSVNGGGMETIMISCKILDSILIQRGIQEVDYCSIDIEGGEMDILETLDLTSHQIKVFSVENNYYGDKLRKFFRDKKYSLVKKVNCDEIYQVRKSIWIF